MTQPTSVEIEWLLLLIAVQHGAQVAMREKDAAAQKVVNGATRQLADALQQGLISNTRDKQLEDRKHNKTRQ